MIKRLGCFCWRGWHCHIYMLHLNQMELRKFEKIYIKCFCQQLSLTFRGYGMSAITKMVRL